MNFNLIVFVDIGQYSIAGDRTATFGENVTVNVIFVDRYCLALVEVLPDNNKGFLFCFPAFVLDEGNEPASTALLLSLVAGFLVFAV